MSERMTEELSYQEWCKVMDSEDGDFYKNSSESKREMYMEYEIRRLQQEVDSWKTTCETLESGLGTKLLADRIKQLQQESEQLKKQVEKERKEKYHWNDEANHRSGYYMQLKEKSIDKQKLLKWLGEEVDEAMSLSFSRPTSLKYVLNRIRSGQFDWREGE